MIVEFEDGELVADPHKIGPNDENQGGGYNAGFSKWWGGWEDIHAMQNVVKAYRATAGNEQLKCFSNPDAKYEYFVVHQDKIKLKTCDLEAAKKYLSDKYQTSDHSSRMIVEYIDGTLTADPHKIGPDDENMGGGVAAGFNKWW